MKKLIPILVVLAAFSSGSAHQVKEPVLVSITARGNDVNGVLADIFSQAKKQYVLQPNLHFALYLSLKDAPYDRALKIVCEQAGLEAELRDGIIYVSKAKPKPIEKPVMVTESVVTDREIIAPAPKPAPAEFLARRLTVRMKKAPLKSVFGEISKATKVPIELGPTVPDVKMDAFMVKTSLKYALDKVTKAVGLHYVVTSRGTIRVDKV